MVGVREKFKQALDNDEEKAGKVLLWMQKLYAMECEAREEALSTKERYILRPEKARLVMDELGRWMMNEYEKMLLPKSTIGKALHYFASRCNKNISIWKMED